MTMKKNKLLKTYGYLTYNPNRRVNSDWWLTIELPKFNDISRHFRWQLDRNWWIADSSPVKRNYHKPPHSHHISVIRGEKPLDNINDWGKWRSNEKIEVFYSNQIRQTNLEKDRRDDIWFVDTFVKDYHIFRKHYGLKYQRDGIPFKGHITIANSF